MCRGVFAACVSILVAEGAQERDVFPKNFFLAIQWRVILILHQYFSWIGCALREALEDFNFNNVVRVQSADRIKN